MDCICYFSTITEHYRLTFTSWRSMFMENLNITGLWNEILHIWINSYLCNKIVVMLFHERKRSKKSTDSHLMKVAFRRNLSIFFLVIYRSMPLFPLKPWQFHSSTLLFELLHGVEGGHDAHPLTGGRFLQLVNVGLVVHHPRHLV